MKYRQTKLPYIISYLAYKWMVAFMTLGYVALYDYFSYKRHSLTLADKSVQLEYGVFTQNSREIPYKNIQSVNVNQSVLGQMFNYGHIIITTAGQNDSVTFKYVDSPQTLRHAIQDKIS